MSGGACAAPVWRERILMCSKREDYKFLMNSSNTKIKNFWINFKFAVFYESLEGDSDYLCNDLAWLREVLWVPLT